MSINYAHQTPVGRIVVLIFLVVAAATGDVMGGMALFVGLSASLVLFYPILSLIRYLCLRWGVGTLHRRLIMLAPPLLLAIWVFSFTNCFGGYQREMIRLGLTAVPVGTSIQKYEGRSGMRGEGCEMTFTCDPDSFRSIISGAGFTQTDGHAPGTRGPVLRYTRSQGTMTCSITTDSTYRWARYTYAAGD